MTTTTRKPTDKHVDAITLLTEDHKQVKKLFSDFEKLTKSEGKSSTKAKLVQEICNALTVHSQVEEEVFYPAVRAAINDNPLMDEADVEHAGAKALISQLKAMKPEDDHYDAKVTVLGESIDHHVKEEEDEMFPKAKKAKVDTEALGVKIMKRKQELQATVAEPVPVKRKKEMAH